MLKALSLLLLFIFLVHFYLLARTGHIDPCDAAFAKLEYETIGWNKYKKRELEIDPEQQPLYDHIAKRHILQCYRIALF